MHTELPARCGRPASRISAAALGLAISIACCGGLIALLATGRGGGGGRSLAGPLRPAAGLSRALVAGARGGDAASASSARVAPARGLDAGGGAGDGGGSAGGVLQARRAAATSSAMEQAASKTDGSSGGGGGEGASGGNDFSSWFVDEATAPVPAPVAPPWDPALDDEPLVPPGEVVTVVDANAIVDPKVYGYAAGGPGTAQWKARQQRFKFTACAGQVVAASVYIGGTGVNVAAAVKDCHTKFDKEKCSRDIFAVIRGTAAIVQYGLQAGSTCGDVNERCGKYISGMFRRIGNIGEAASRMAQGCRTDTDSFFFCGRQLERIAWALGPFGGDISGGFLACTSSPRDRHIQDYGLCAGQILASAAYVAAAAMEFVDLQEECGYKNGTVESCWFVLSSGLRALAIGAEKATRAVGHCGGLATRCGRDVSLLSAGLLALSQNSASIAMRCRPNTVQTRATFTGSTRDCNINSMATAKSFMVVIAKALDASDSCRGSETANIACGAGISKALASIGFMAENIARTTVDCSDRRLNTESLYLCGRNIERVGQGADVFARSIGQAAADCGFGTGPRATKQIGLPRRFYT
eukprot:TRINITY_DN8830_c0_g1_i1.p1 TRINITY_DN8830_c0_g1~~TRINITY_DN8830_c0_g1_i1.p1  ORF type:complete len:584 (-),score=123.12 TRINITY_DN8830_c0_g1_i1:54-1805(-)